MRILFFFDILAILTSGLQKYAVDINRYMCLRKYTHTHTHDCEGSPWNLDPQLLNARDLSISDMNHSSPGTKPPAGLQQLMSIPASLYPCEEPPSYCTWRLRSLWLCQCMLPMTALPLRVSLSLPIEVSWHFPGTVQLLSKCEKLTWRS